MHFIWLESSLNFLQLLGNAFFLNSNSIWVKIGLEVWVTVQEFLGSEARRDKASRACRDGDLESHFSVRLVPV